jgi:hypothetical protein
LDVIQFSLFQEDKIGIGNGWLFEGYLAGIILQELFAGLRNCVNQISLANSLESTCQEIQKLLLPHELPFSNFDGACRAITDQNDEMRRVVSQKLAAARQGDFRHLFSLYSLKSAADLIARDCKVGDLPLTLLFLLDRYDDATPFQQTVANALFQRGGPSNFFVKAAVRPPSIDSLQVYGGGKISDPQHFRVVDLETCISEEDYFHFLARMTEKMLESARDGLGCAGLKTAIDALLDTPQNHEGYAGFRSLGSLSDGLAFNFLLLCEKAIERAKPIANLCRGGTVSVQNQNDAAKDVADIIFTNIASKVVDEYTAAQRLVRLLLREMVSKRKGPSIVFRAAKSTSEGDIIWKAIKESILKEAKDHDEEPDDWVVELNKIFLPRKAISLERFDILEIPFATLKDTISRCFVPRKKEQQPGLFPPPKQMLVPAARTSWEPAVGSRITRFQAFISDNRVDADKLLEALEYSRKIIADAQRELTPELYSQFKDEIDFLSGTTVGIGGSFARGEAIEGDSDADVFVAGRIADHPDVAERMLDVCCAWFESRSIKVTRPDPGTPLHDPRFRPFPMVIDTIGIMERANTPQDSEEDKTRRMCLITESAPIFNEGVFDEFRKALRNRMNTQQLLNATVLPETLLREFVAWCNSFVSRIQVQSKSGPKYEKRKLQRTFMEWSTVLSCLAHACQGHADCFQSMPELFELPSVLRLHHVCEAVAEKERRPVVKHIGEIIGAYNTALNNIVLAGKNPSHPTYQEVASRSSRQMEDAIGKLREKLLHTSSIKIHDSYDSVLGTT